MYKSFRIKNFRGFQDFEINSLERINLIAGKNNVGKTALLESFWLHHGADNPTLGLKIDKKRGISALKAEEFLTDLFLHFDTDQKIEFISEGKEKDESQVTTISQQEQGKANFPVESGGEVWTGEEGTSSQIPTPLSPRLLIESKKQPTGESSSGEIFLTEEGVQAKIHEKWNRPNGIYVAAQVRISPQSNANRFGELRESREQDKLINLLQKIDERVRDLTVIPMGGSSIIHVDLKGYEKLIPVPLLGEGMNRVLTYALAISEASDGGIVLIDEIENGLHHSILPDVWSALAKLAREFQVQIFATTHSWECVKAAHSSFLSGKKYDFRLQRLDRADGEIQSVSYNQESLDASLEEGIEVR